MKTKVFVLLFALMTNVIVTSAAVVEGTCGPNLTWSLDTQDSTLTISGAGAMEDYYSYKKSPWDYYYSYIAYLSLPEGLTKIGSRAFFACRNLKSVLFPNSLVSTGSEAFKGCTKLSAVSFGSGFVTVGSNTFYGCSELVTLTNSNYVRVIGSNAFSECTKLAFFDMSQVRSIADYAFDKCNSLTDIELPDCLTNIGSNAFYDCSSLTTIVVPNNVVNLGSSAFAACSKLASVTLPSTLLDVPEAIFLNCRSLTNIIIPESSRSIGKNAFAGCSSLADVVLGENILYLYDYAFCGCNSLTSIEIPKKVHYISSLAFKDCKNLVSITWNAKNASDAQYTYPQFGGDKSKVTSFVFGDSVEYIPASLCYNMTGLTSVSIPDSVTKIGTGAFAGCANLSSVSIGSGILNIGSNAFGKAYLSDNTPITSLTVEAITPPAGGLNCGINPAICTLYVPEESVELYSNTLWWEDFLHIRAIGSTHTITFVDMDGTILSTQTFDEGETIIPPTTPQHEGYTFIGWDTDLTNITSDITITAQYTINRYRIQFIDWDGTIIKTDSVEYLSNIVPPANPTRIATAEFTYTFAGWTPKIVPVIGDATYTARYNSIINKYTITFKNDDGSELCAEEWDYGTMPYCEEPMKEDDEQYRYTFAGWSPDIVVVKADATYTATYTVTPKSQGIEDVLGEDVQCKKLVRDGQIFLLRGDQTYTLQGQEVK